MRNPDCTASGNIDIRVTKKPEHGTVETTPEINFPTYPKESSRYKCMLGTFPRARRSSMLKCG
jgi:hypothetical protein